MPNSKIVKSKTLWGVLFAALFAGVLLAACGGGGGGSPEVAAAAAAPTTAPVAGAPIAFSAPPTQTAPNQVTVSIPNTTPSGALIVTSGAPVVITTSIPTLGPTTTVTTTATSATTTSITVPGTLPAIPSTTTVTGSVSSVGGVIPSPGCTTATTGTASAITLPKSAVDMDTVPSRFAGVAPLAVFFDATGTTATAAPTRPFHDLEYRWNFGDNDTLTWGYGAHVGDGSILAKKNRATGPIAAHVFETPGTYIVNLTVTDGTNTVSNSCVQIAVSDPDVVFAGANTVCFSTSGDFTGAPAGDCTTPGVTAITTSNFTSAVDTYQATGKRLLFKCGETFSTVVSSATISAAGPGILGAYPVGCLNKPIIQAGLAGGIIFLSSSSHTPATTDWRIMDLAIDGAAFASGAIAINAGGGFTRMTILRTDMYDVKNGVLLSGGVLDSINATDPKVPPWDQVFLVDSTIQRIHGSGYAVYPFGTRQAYLGNLLYDVETFATSGGHTMRMDFAQKIVTSDNEFNKSHAAAALLTLRAIHFDTASPTIPAGTYSEYLYVSDNKFVGTATPQLMSFKQGQNGADERLRNVIAERNWYINGAGTAQAIANQASFSTIRNNVFDTSATSGGLGPILLEQPAGTTSPPQPMQDSVFIYDNTIYSSMSGTANVNVINLSNSPTNLSVINNLVYAPNFTGTGTWNMVSGTPGTGYTASNNSTGTNGGTDAMGMRVDPLLTSYSPFNPTNAKPTTVGVGSYAIGNGATVPVLSDFFGNPRTAPYDMGAVNH